MTLSNFANQFRGSDPHSGSTILSDVKGTSTISGWNATLGALTIVLQRHLNQPAVAFSYLDYSSDVEATNRKSKLKQVRVLIDETELLCDVITRLEDALEQGNPGQSSHSDDMLVSFLDTSEDPQSYHRFKKMVDSILKSGHQLVFHIQQSHSSFQLHYASRSDFPIDYLQSLVNHFAEAFHNIATRDDVRHVCLADIEILDQTETMQVRQLSMPRRSYETVATIHGAFHLQAISTPSFPALQGEDHLTISYSQLDCISNKMAQMIVSEVESRKSLNVISGGPGIKNAGVIAIMLPRSPNIVISQLACWKAGYAIVVLDPTPGNVRQRSILEELKCALVLIHRSYQDPQLDHLQLWRFKFELLQQDTKEHVDQSLPYSSNDLVMEDPHRLAWIMYTSGSTGRPKGCRHSHASLGSPLINFKPPLSRKTLLFLSPASAASALSIYVFLLHGKCVCILPASKLTPRLDRCIDDYGIEDITITPSAMSLLEPGTLPSLKSITFLGESISRTLVEKWSVEAEVRLHYGSTEIGSHYIPTCAEVHHLPPSIPIPLSDCSVYVLRPGTDKVCALFVPGELCFSSTFMSSGYVSASEDQQNAFQSHPFPLDAGHKRLYRSGDLGVLLGSNKFAVLGRLDYQIKIDGNRVQPAEVEQQALSFSQVKAAKVILLDMIKAATILCGCIVQDKAYDNSTTSDWPNLTMKLDRRCKDTLPNYMVPQRWIALDEIPITITGKVDIKRLQEMAQQKISEASHWTTKSTDVLDLFTSLSEDQRAVADIALKLLTGSHPSGYPEQTQLELLSMPFISCGGTSLTAMRLVNLANAQGVAVSLSQILSAHRIIDMCMSVSEPATFQEDIKSEPTCPREYPIPEDFHIPRNDVEAIYPTSMLQNEMVMMALYNPRNWILYRYLDLSSLNPSRSQVKKALGILVKAKPILRTVMVPAIRGSMAQYQAKARKSVDLSSQNLLQVVLKPKAAPFEFSSDYGAHDFTAHYLADFKKGQTLGERPWRACFFDDSKTLALFVGHSLTDFWTGQFIEIDLRDTLVAIINDDPIALEKASTSATRPSMQAWVERMYGSKGLDGSEPAAPMQRGIETWQRAMAGASPTYLPFSPLLPFETFPPLNICVAAPESTSNFREWCTLRNVTSGTLFNTVFALTLAHTAVDRSPDEVTYYRYMGNRGTAESWDIEGALVSMAPIRVSTSASLSIVEMMQETLRFQLETHSATAFYVDNPITENPHVTMKRPFGNATFNHLIERAEDTEVFEDHMADKGGFLGETSMGLVLEFVLEETKDGIIIDGYSWWPREKLQNTIEVYLNLLELVLRDDGTTKATTLLQNLEITKNDAESLNPTNGTIKM